MPIKTNTFFSTDREIQNLKAQAKRFTVKDKLNNGLFIEVKGLCCTNLSVKAFLAI
ncbi:MAG: hypothetical protein JNL15_10910 [Acinetobacter johnsonii]|nr:hypothetical protein [Acinetobacter johnsonii]